MNQELSQIREAMREAMTALLAPIQTSRQIDPSAFARLHAQALLLVYACKGTEEVPKSLMGELLATYSILRNEAPYFGKDRQTLEEMATKIEQCFRLIIADEVPEDRRPGVPRII